MAIRTEESSYANSRIYPSGALENSDRSLRLQFSGNIIYVGGENEQRRFQIVAPRAEDLKPLAQLFTDLGEVLTPVSEATSRHLDTGRSRPSGLADED